MWRTSWLRSPGRKMCIRDRFGAGVRTGTTAVYTVKPGSTGHSGGDEGIMAEFVSLLKGERENTNTIAQSVHSHVMAFAAVSYTHLDVYKRQIRP